MELLLIIIVVVIFYGIYKIFSYLKNNEVSYAKSTDEKKDIGYNTEQEKTTGKEIFKNARSDLQKIIDKKKEEIRNRVRVITKWENPLDVIAPMDDIENKPWRMFEREVAEMFYNRGFDVVLGPGLDDDGKDIVIRKNSDIYLVQCKHYYGRKMVTANEVRDFQGAIDLYEKKNNKKVKGIFITSGKSSAKARETASTLGIELWDKFNWKDKVSSL